MYHVQQWLLRVLIHKGINFTLQRDHLASFNTAKALLLPPIQIKSGCCFQHLRSSTSAAVSVEHSSHPDLKMIMELGYAAINLGTSALDYTLQPEISGHSLVKLVKILDTGRDI